MICDDSSVCLGIATAGPLLSIPKDAVRSGSWREAAQRGSEGRSPGPFGTVGFVSSRLEGVNCFKIAGRLGYWVDVSI